MGSLRALLKLRKKSTEHPIQHTAILGHMVGAFSVEAAASVFAKRGELPGCNTHSTQLVLATTKPFSSLERNRPTVLALQRLCSDVRTYVRLTVWDGLCEVVHKEPSPGIKIEKKCRQDIQRSFHFQLLWETHGFAPLVEFELHVHVCESTWNSSFHVWHGDMLIHVAIPVY